MTKEEFGNALETLESIFVVIVVTKALNLHFISSKKVTRVVEWWPKGLNKKVGTKGNYEVSSTVLTKLYTKVLHIFLEGITKAFSLSFERPIFSFL